MHGISQNDEKLSSKKILNRQIVKRSYLKCFRRRHRDKETILFLSYTDSLQHLFFHIQDLNKN